MKRLLFLLLFFCVGMSGAMARSILAKDTVTYPFIVDSLSALQFPDSVHFERRDAFYDKLDSLVLCREGKISILHIGGSHVQADCISHAIRCHFDSLNEEFRPARGLFFPYKVAKTNNPSSFSVKSKGEWTASKNVKKEREAVLGMTGIAVSTQDYSAGIQVKLNTDSLNKRWTFTRLHLLGYGDSMAVPLLCEEDNSFHFPIEEEGHKSFLYEFNAPQDSFALWVAQTDSVPHKFHLRGFIAENDEPGIVYHSIGVNGAAVPSYLSCEDFKNDLALIRPDMVVFAIGINDAVPVNFSEDTFITRYDSLISIIEEVNPSCFYIFMTNNDSFRKHGRRYNVNLNGLKVEHAFRVLAEKHHGGYWDLFGWMGGLKSMREWEKLGLARKDKIHFTKKGYEKIGTAFYNAVMKSYLERDIDDGK